MKEKHLKELAELDEKVLAKLVELKKDKKIMDFIKMPGSVMMIKMAVMKFSK